jgi:hypothetical protein
MTRETLKGALKSRTVWWNILLALLASLEMMAGNLTTLFGQEVAASILLGGALANLFLRTITTQALEDKK